MVVFGGVGDWKRGNILRCLAFMFVFFCASCMATFCSEAFAETALRFIFSCTCNTASFGSVPLKEANAHMDGEEEGKGNPSVNYQKEEKKIN